MSEATIQLSRFLKLETLTEDSQLDSIRQEWDELLDHSDQRVFFLRWSWNRLWWRTYRPSNSHLFLITCRDEHGQLAGLAPFYLRQHCVAGIPHLKEVLFLGTGVSIKTSEYLDIVSRFGHEQTVAETIADFLRQSGDWDRLCLWGIPANSRVLPYFREALGARARVKLCDRFVYIDTRSNWETVQAGLARHLRREIDHRLSRLLKQHTCEFGRVENLDDLGPAVCDFVRLHQARWQAKGQPGSFAIPKFECFMREAMQFSLAEGRLRFWRLVIDGQCSAVLVAFVDRGIAHYFQGGFDPDYAKFSIGTLMLALCIQECIEAGDISQFDFMGGGAAYKDDWARTTLEAIELELLRPGIYSLVYSARARGRQILAYAYHTLVSDSPKWKWIRKQLQRIRPHRRGRNGRRRNRTEEEGTSATASF